MISQSLLIASIIPSGWFLVLGDFFAVILLGSKSRMCLSAEFLCQPGSQILLGVGTTDTLLLANSDWGKNKCS